MTVTPLPPASSISLLGPQRPRPVLAETLSSLGVRGAVAVITAGWRHVEDELDALVRDLGPLDLRLVHLPLYAWFDQLLGEETVLGADYRKRQRDIVAWKAGHRESLVSAMQAVRRMESRARSDPDRFGEDLSWTLGVLHALDQRALDRLDAIRADYPISSRPWEFPRVRAHHAHVRDVLSHVGAVLIAGGHVGVLRNRMDFFGVDVLLRRYLRAGGHLVAWSAGAMVLGERIYLYYDDPPEGEAEAELFDRGFGIAPGTVWLPHARRRLRFEDAQRTGRLGRRLDPLVAIGLENGARFDHRAGEWQDRSRPDSACQFRPGGAPGPVELSRFLPPDCGEQP